MGAQNCRLLSSEQQPQMEGDSGNQVAATNGAGGEVGAEMAAAGTRVDQGSGAGGDGLAPSPQQHQSLDVPRARKSISDGATYGKVTLQYGHSIMDWVRRTSGKIIASKQIPFVDAVELRKHMAINDCWVVLDNKVYDITEYLTYHPGGVNLLMRAAGCDATHLFNQYHAWINYDSMLKACFVGYFKGDSRALPNPKEEWHADEEDEPGLNSDPFLGLTPNKKPAFDLKVTETSQGKLHLMSKMWNNLINDNICVQVNDTRLRIVVKHFHQAPIAMKWRGIPKELISGPFSVTAEESTIKLQFNHADDMDIFSSTDLLTINRKPDMEFYECTITKILKITHDMNLYELTLPDNIYLTVPVGHHVYLRIITKSKSPTKPYTPVRIEPEAHKIWFLIKIYTNGQFTSVFNRHLLGDKVEISEPIGTIDFRSACSKRLLMLTAGTGITAVTRLLAVRNKQGQHCIGSKKCALFLLNKTVEDCVDESFFEHCGVNIDDAKHIEFEHYESDNHDENILAMSKFIDKQMQVMEPRIKQIEESRAAAAAAAATAAATGGGGQFCVLICGPDGFVNEARKLCMEKSPSLAALVHVFGM